MLTHLAIRNFAIFDQFEFAPQPGLNLMTGESGAGKSVLLKALQFIFGERGDVDLIRAGKDECEVSASFEKLSDPVRAWLEAQEIRQEEELLLRRVYQRSGRGKAWINGSLVTLAALHELATQLTRVVGQHAAQTLFLKQTPLFTLDAFGRYNALREEYERDHIEFTRLRKQLELLRSELAQSREQEEFYRFQLRELNEARLRPGEEEELLAERKIVQHASRIQESLGIVESMLYSSEHSIVSLLGRANQVLQKISGLDSRIDQEQTRLQKIGNEIEESARFFQSYLEQIEFEPGRLDDLEGRLEQISRLQKKYGSTVEGILEKQAEIERKLEQVDHSEERVEGLESEIAKAGKSLAEKARRLSQGRKEAAGKLAKVLEKELHALALSQARFEVRVSTPEPFPDFTSSDLYSSTGVDSVEFYFAPNPGEEFKPLASIVSGGELSRIYLALQSLLTPMQSSSPTFIFDEVDTGLSGHPAQKVGEKLKKLAQNAQVICITHLPQVAAFADHHFQISKAEREGRTSSSIRKLDLEEREKEIARMLAGSQITQKAILNARELMELGLVRQ